jgi:hypothetical protein
MLKGRRIRFEFAGHVVELPRGTKHFFHALLLYRVIGLFPPRTRKSAELGNCLGWRVIHPRNNA